MSDVPGGIDELSASPLEMWGFSTPEMTRIFSPSSIVRAMLQFERGLALALFDAGVAPRDEAQAVAAACEAPIADPEAILESTWTAGTPVIALIEEIRERLSTESERMWVQHGSTTQDVIDTAHMLLAGRALRELEASLTRIATEMRGLVHAHRDQPQMGRTFLQHAQPTSFGLRVAGWLEPTVRHIEALRASRSRLVVQLGGPVGNLSAYGPRGREVVRALAGHLDLGDIDLAWHSDRSRFREIVGSIEGAVATMAKVALDMALLAQSDTAELTVRAGSSSSMSHKRNPIDAIRALAAADITRGAASMIHEARPQELDRGLGAWHAEWVALPLLFQSASAVFEAVGSGLESMEVDGAAMAATAGPDATGQLARVDSRQVDAVLTRYEEIVEET